jgi:serine/threonine protein kinase/WD40 repeat protein
VAVEASMEFRICGACRRAVGSGTLCPGCEGPLELVEPAFFIGQVFGKYRIEEVLGAGGMGVVFRAVHATLHRSAALKLLSPQLLDDAFLKRFLREAQVLAQLKHPNIVEVYDFDTASWGMPYYVMEYLTGQSLRPLIVAQGASPNLSAYADILPPLAAGLAYAHSQGLVHRDLKPDNVFVTRVDGRRVPKIIDFGIAKVLRRGGSETTDVTGTGAIMGTLNYLAPEQVHLTEVGPWTDQYALALMVAEMVSGKIVRAGLTLGEICGSAINKPFSVDGLQVPAIPPAIRDAVLKATQPDPRDRFASVGDFASAMGFAPAEASPLPCFSGIDSVPTMATPRSSHSAPVSGDPPPAGSSTPRLPSGAVLPTAPESRSAGRRLAFPLAGLILILALATTLGYRFLRHSPPDGPAVSGARETVPAPLSEKPRTAPLPPDAASIIAQQGDVLVLEGKECLYLMEGGSPQAPTRVVLAPGQAIAGASRSGHVYMVEGGRLLTKAYNRNAGEDGEMARGLPPADRYAVSPSGRWVASQRGSAIQFFQVAGGRLNPSGSGPRTDPGLFHLGESVAAGFGDSRLWAYDLASAKLLWEVPLSEGRIHRIRVEEAAGWITVCGWFDGVSLFDLAAGSRREVPRKGQTFAVALLPDGPTLAMAGDQGLSLWQEGKGEIFTWKNARGYRDLLYTGTDLLAVDRDGHTLSWFPYRGFPIQRTVGLSAKEIWALQASSTGSLLYAGGADGALYSLVFSETRGRAQNLHSQGVTALALTGDHLASASDDRTIAVWQVPAMKVEWRSKAHGFLVNALRLQGKPPVLWSTSSDGTVKKWSWPQLDEREVVDASRLAGSRLSLAALWVSQDERLLLAGTWNYKLVVLERGAAGWKARTLPVPSKSLYSCAHLAKSETVVFAGAEPGLLFVYDLRSGTLREMPSLGTSPYWVEPVPGEDAVVVTGSGVILKVELARDSSSRLAYTIRVAANTDLHTLLCAAWVPGKDVLAAGNEKGQVVFIPKTALLGPVRAKGALSAR